MKTDEEGNAGKHNAGTHNLGNNNIGSYNVGDHNLGYFNHGDKNYGDQNYGDQNFGDQNFGDLNCGHNNIGRCNYGSQNLGHYNSTERALGSFNTKPTSQYRLFNKASERCLDCSKIPLFLRNVELTSWIPKKDMTEDEKSDHPSYKICGGYLRHNDYKKAIQKAWAQAREEDRRALLDLPNWDNEIFEEITGIDVEKELKIKPKLQPTINKEDSIMMKVDEHGNVGSLNDGLQNFGNHNIGGQNWGYRNYGDQNFGDQNHGEQNLGDQNFGAKNLGDQNQGHQNNGHNNIGAHNVGYYNLGDHNFGLYNYTNRAVGCFNTKPNLEYSIFNKPTHHRLFIDELPAFLRNVHLTSWIAEEAMTEQEKRNNPSYETCRGYLRRNDYKKAIRKAWDAAPEEDRRAVLALPNWDNAIFEEITGIDVEKELQEPKS